MRVLVLTMIYNPLILTRLQELGVLAVIQKSQLHVEIEVAHKAIAKGKRVRGYQPALTSVLDDGTDLDERFSLLSRSMKFYACLFMDKASMKSPDV